MFSDAFNSQIKIGVPIIPPNALQVSPIFVNSLSNSNTVQMPSRLNLCLRAPALKRRQLMAFTVSELCLL